MVYVTKQIDSDKLAERDRPASEITPQMIEAGAFVVSDFREIADDRELALRVYTAMSAASEPLRNHRARND